MTATVLLVEDNALNRDMLSRRLDKMGYQVLLAVDGEDGVAQTRALMPDVVLMDINMPVMDGWQAVRILKDDPRTRAIPVIALTAHAMSSHKDKADEIGFDDFATKPIDFPALVQTIEAIMHTQSLNAEPIAHQEQ